MQTKVKTLTKLILTETDISQLFKPLCMPVGHWNLERRSQRTFFSGIENLIGHTKPSMKHDARWIFKQCKRAWKKKCHVWSLCTAAKVINNQKVRVLENLISSQRDDNSARVFVSQTVTNMMLGNLIVLLIGFVSFVLTLEPCNNRVVTSSIFPAFILSYHQFNCPILVYLTLILVHILIGLCNYGK